MTARKSFLDVHGRLMEIARFGESGRGMPTIVLMHEGLGCVEMWREFPGNLSAATGAEVMAFSRFGHGRSDPPAKPRTVRFMHEEALDVLPEVITAAGLTDYWLVGHSDGGSIALIYSGNRPGDGLRGVVTLAAHVFCEEKTLDSIRKARETFEKGDLLNRLQKYHGGNTEAAFYGWNRPWLDLDFKAWNIEAYLPQIKVPVLAIQGEEDEYGTLAQVDAIVHGVSGPCEKLMLKSCGHAPHRTKEKELLESITSFLNPAS